MLSRGFPSLFGVRDICLQPYHLYRTYQSIILTWDTVLHIHRQQLLFRFCDFFFCCLAKRFRTQRDPFGDFFGDDPFDDPFFSGGMRGRNRGVMLAKALRDAF